MLAIIGLGFTVLTLNWFDVATAFPLIGAEFNVGLAPRTGARPRVLAEWPGRAGSGRRVPGPHAGPGKLASPAGAGCREA